MAEVTLKRCDVYGTTKGVERYQIRVMLESEVGDSSDMPEGDQWTEVDLSPRGHKRLLHFIDRGIKPPTRKKAVAP